MELLIKIGLFLLGYTVWFITDIASSGIRSFKELDWKVWWGENQLSTIISMVNMVGYFVIGIADGDNLSYEAIFMFPFTVAAITKNFEKRARKVKVNKVVNEEPEV